MTLTRIPARPTLYFPFNKLNAAKFNPTVRVSAPALESLRASIRKVGILASGHVLHRPVDGYVNVIVDCHRRVASGRLEGVPGMYCQVHTEGEPETLWALLNKDTRRINSIEWMEAFYNTADKMVHFMPKVILGDINACMDIFGGRDGLKYLIDCRTAPGVSRVIRFTHRAFSDELSDKPLLTKKRVGKWIVEHGLQKDLRVLYRSVWTRQTLGRLWLLARDNQPIDDVGRFFR